MIAIKMDRASKEYSRRGSAPYLRDTITNALSRVGLRSRPFAHSSFLALKNVSFEVKKGDAVGIIGRNGAGKSTILKLLAGVTKPTSGTIAVQGRIAPLIEVGAGFHPELSGRENIYLNGSILGMRRAEIEAAVHDIIRFAEVEEFIDMPVKHYSSGMYMRLGFAIAAHTRPDIYLIDEVLAVGDASFQHRCLDTLAAHRADGKTLVLVTHSLEQVEKLCERCIFLDHGEVRFEGPTTLAIKEYRAHLRHVPAGQTPASDVPHREAYVLTLTSHDREGRPTDHFGGGDDITLRVTYRIDDTVQTPLALAVIIHGPQDEHLASCYSPPLPDTVGEHVVLCQLHGVPFTSGSYFVSMYLMTTSPDGPIYDALWQRYRITIRSKRSQADGLITMSSDWDIVRRAGADVDA